MFLDTEFASHPTNSFQPHLCALIFLAASKAANADELASGTSMTQISTWITAAAHSRAIINVANILFAAGTTTNARQGDHCRAGAFITGWNRKLPTTAETSP
jgi:hypothetical protein